MRHVLFLLFLDLLPSSLSYSSDLFLRGCTSSIPPTACRVIELPVRGMDCTECTQHVQHALAAVPGVQSVEVFLSSEKAVLSLDPAQVKMEALHQAVEVAGNSVPSSAAAPGERTSA